MNDEAQRLDFENLHTLIFSLRERTFKACSSDEKIIVCDIVTRLVTDAAEQAAKGEWYTSLSFGRWAKDSDYDLEGADPQDMDLLSRAMDALFVAELDPVELLAEIRQRLSRCVPRRKLHLPDERVPEKLVNAAAEIINGWPIGDERRLAASTAAEGDYVTILIRWGEASIVEW